MSEDCLKDLPNPTLLARGIRESHINKQTGKIKKAAFIPRRNGKDDDGISISQPLSDTRKQLFERVQPQGEFFCSLIASDVRAIFVDPVRLDVCAAPTQRDPYHALIKNVPTDLGRAAIAIRCAELLAEVSTQYKPPEEGVLQ